MLKHILFYLLASLLAVVFSHYGHMLIIGIDMLYLTINAKLALIFSGGYLGVVVRKILVLALLPVILVGIPALIYRLVKGKMMPWFPEATWLVWLMVTLSNVLIR